MTLIVVVASRLQTTLIARCHSFGCSHAIFARMAFNVPYDNAPLDRARGTIMTVALLKPEER